METGLTSIIVPTFNHAEWLPDAIESALAQTAPVEVIVVDDGSSDGTDAVLERYRRTAMVRAFSLPHGGPSTARNFGLAQASGDFVMFLDADDVISPAKVATQLEHFDESVGWVMCDVRIEDAVPGRVENASGRYRYKQRQLGGWIRDQLAASNFIPIMSPLVRRSVLGDDVRFGELKPEDWHFWYRVAAHARVRYIPKVLATYRKRRGGRNSERRGAIHVTPDVGAEPVLLNLGCGTPGSASWHPQPGCVNLDRAMGWCFEDGLPQYADGTVAAITVSHALMYVAAQDWPAVFSEFARVLQPHGIIRITEDDTEHPDSSRRGGWKGSEPAITNTSPGFVAKALEAAGLRAHLVTATTTRYVSDALCQAQHGRAPDVFFIEGVKETQEVGLFLSPHHDDETLFGSATIIKHRPRVVVCFPSVRDYGETWEREHESRAALEILGGTFQQTLDGRDLVAHLTRLDASLHPVRVWAPDPRASHPDHRAVAAAAAAVFGPRVTTYHTYDERGKVVGRPVEFEPGWAGRKLRALACYETQIRHPRASGFFMEDLREFSGEAP